MTECKCWFVAADDRDFRRHMIDVHGHVAIGGEYWDKVDDAELVRLLSQSRARITLTTTHGQSDGAVA